MCTSACAYLQCTLIHLFPYMDVSESFWLVSMGVVKGAVSCEYVPPRSSWMVYQGLHLHSLILRCIRDLFAPAPEKTHIFATYLDDSWWRTDLPLSILLIAFGDSCIIVVGRKCWWSVAIVVSKCQLIVAFMRKCCSSDRLFS